MFKTLQEVKIHKETISEKGFFSAIIYFFSPILNDVEERHLYADSNYELMAWLKDTGKYYRDKGISYSAYNNGAFVDGFGNPFEKLSQN